MRKREKKAEVEERGQRRGRKIERGRGGDIMMNESGEEMEEKEEVENDEDEGKESA